MTRSAFPHRLAQSILLGVLVASVLTACRRQEPVGPSCFSYTCEDKECPKPDPFAPNCDVTMSADGMQVWLNPRVFSDDYSGCDARAEVDLSGSVLCMVSSGYVTLSGTTLPGCLHTVRDGYTLRCADHDPHCQP